MLSEAKHLDRWLAHGAAIGYKPLPMSAQAPDPRPAIVPPHGGTLVDRIVPAQEVDALVEHARGLASVVLDARERADLELIATGAASPLHGLLRSADYQRVRGEMRLADGTVWPLPLTLAVAPDVAATLAPGDEVALRDETASLLGILELAEVYERDPVAESAAVYGTEDSIHPGVAYLLARPRTLLAGPVRALPLSPSLPFAEHRKTPRALREEIARRGWRTVAGFQTRNPIHRAHEHLTKLAL